MAQGRGFEPRHRVIDLLAFQASPFSHLGIPATPILFYHSSLTLNRKETDCMYVTYKYLLRPNKYQRKMIELTIECSNIVRNLCISNNEQEIAKRSAKRLVDRYMAENPKLKECDYSALMNALFDLTNEDVKYISNRNTFTTSYSDFLRERFPMTDNRVFFPKIGWIPYKKHREIPDLKTIFKMIISIDKLGKYHLYLYCRTDEAKNVPLDINNSIGLDYSSTHFIVDSNGTKYDIPHFYRDSEKRKKQLLKEMERKTPGSTGYKEVERKVLKLERSTSNQRRDTLHKLSTQLAEKYDYIFVETLSMKSISETGHLSKATYDNGYNMFLEMLEYKMRKRGKILYKIDKWFPSSKTCHKCGYIYKDMKMTTRAWVCPQCMTELDRDINAAINIKEEGKKKISAGRAEHS